MGLTEPEVGEALIAADRALAEAVRARLAQAAAAPDAQVIALRQALAGASDLERAVLKAAWGRVRAAARPVVAAGPAARLLAADRFGGPRQALAGAEAALAAGDAALIDVDGLGPWWARLLARPERAVIGALPDDPRGSPLALLVGPETTGPTGEDRTFWVTDAAGPDARVVAAFATAGLVAGPCARAGGLKLFVLTGYVQPHDPRLEDPAVATLGRLSGVIGHAPVL